MPPFRPGLALAESFYRETVEPLLDRPHAALLAGEGSEVLGFDQPRSTDHAWGPRLQLVVASDDEDLARVRARLDARLPATTTAS